MRTVSLPALSFTALRRERAFLTSRPNARRMARHPQPKAPEWPKLPDHLLHAHALNLKTHAGRLRALQSLTEYVRKL